MGSGFQIQAGYLVCFRTCRDASSSIGECSGTNPWRGQHCKPVGDPGFPRGGGANPKGGAPTYYLANFSRKLHKNEEILGRGGRASLALSLDPPL